MPRVKVFAGKAAPGYRVAKQVIRLAHDVAQVVNNDPSVAGRLKIVFLPNYNVSLAEQIIPAADLSEQISTAGMEASGTGNMKFALNGALTIGTLDGANVEIRDHVGAANIFIFGLTVEQVEARRRRGLAAHDEIHASLALQQAIQSVRGGVFSPGDPHRYAEMMHNLVEQDTFLVAADFDSYVATQEAVERFWREPAAWWRASILNIANVGWFSSDRSIAEYARDIWHVPVPQARSVESGRSRLIRPLMTEVRVSPARTLGGIKNGPVRWEPHWRQGGAGRAVGPQRHGLRARRRPRHTAARADRDPRQARRLLRRQEPHHRFRALQRAQLRHSPHRRRHPVPRA